MLRFRPLRAAIETPAPRILGAVFSLIAVFLTASCEKKGNSPDWNTPAGAEQAAVEPMPVVPATLAAMVAAPAPVVETPATEAGPVATEGLRFINYNVKNWLTMDRYVNREQLKGAPKPDSEKEAVIAILARHKPDIIGLCEIGEASDLTELQEMLKAAGSDLPHSHFTGGSDSVRRLAILSRYPITSTAKPTVTDYQLDGKTFAIGRGILDATIEARGKPYRFLGVHFKSKREVDEGDQEAMRMNEARLVRRHVESILADDADARLIVYGDFNDTRATPAIRALTGKYNDPTYLTAIPAKDSRNDAWTHHWAPHDIYSRIDFITVTQAMKPDVDFQAAKVIDDPDWSAASDHRPMLAIFR